MWFDSQFGTLTPDLFSRRNCLESEASMKGLKTWEKRGHYNNMHPFMG